jgi:hypothetical protein
MIASARVVCWRTQARRPAGSLGGGERELGKRRSISVAGAAPPGPPSLSAMLA